MEDYLQTHQATIDLGISGKVTLFTASDFNRTHNSNGNGSDHAWGSHHLIVVGGVRSGNLYGEMPALEIRRPPPVLPTSPASETPIPASLSEVLKIREILRIRGFYFPF